MRNRVEASHYIKKVDCTTKIPYLGRQGTILFVETLYRLGAFSVEISDIQPADGGSNFIMEIYVRVEVEKARDVLVNLIATYPIRLEEMEAKPAKVYKVLWNLDYLYKQVIKNGFPQWSHNFSE